MDEEEEEESVFIDMFDGTLTATYGNRIIQKIRCTRINGHHGS